MAGGIFPAIYGTVLLVLVIGGCVPFGVSSPSILLNTRERNRSSINGREWPLTTSLVCLRLSSDYSALDSLSRLSDAVWTESFIRATSYTGNLDNLGVDDNGCSHAADLIITVEETMRAVPREYREASLALGATRLQTIFGLFSLSPGLGNDWSDTGNWPGCRRSRSSTVYRSAYFLPQLPTRANQQFMHLGYHVTPCPHSRLTSRRPNLYSTLRFSCCWF